MNDSAREPMNPHDPGPAAPDFKAVFESEPGPYLLLDPELRIVAVTDTYAEATMANREDLIGRRIFEVFKETAYEQPPLRSMHAQLAAIVESSADAIVSEARARMIFETSPLAMLLVDAHHYIVQANTCADQLFGYPPGRLIGLPVEALVPERFRAHHPSLVESYFQHPEPRQLGRGRDLWGMKADGVEFPCEISLAPLTIGPETQAIVSIVDITQRERAAAEILRLNNDLERRVEARTAELQAANRELESFAYAVSHDLRAPLRAMSGFSQALIEDFGDRLEGEARAYLDQIIRASRHMGELIDGLLALSRCTQGELRREKVDLSTLAERIRDELSQTERFRQVLWDIAPDLVTHGDPRMLEAVMRNLLLNAWKYTAHKNDAVIRVYSEHAGENRLFCITDNGAGFSMSHSNKLFQPFQRLHRQDEFPGLGIGLATVQRIIHRHGGTIGATAEPGRGAKFFFTLPALDNRDEEVP